MHFATLSCQATRRSVAAWTLPARVFSMARISTLSASFKDGENFVDGGMGWRVSRTMHHPSDPCKGNIPHLLVTSARRRSCLPGVKSIPSDTKLPPCDKPPCQSSHSTHSTKYIGVNEVSHKGRRRWCADGYGGFNLTHLVVATPRSWSTEVPRLTFLALIGVHVSHFSVFIQFQEFGDCIFGGGVLDLPLFLGTASS